MKRRSDGRRLTHFGDAEPACGRKFCSQCGRWRLLFDFGARRSRDGEILSFRSQCKTCTRVRQRAAERERRRQYEEQGIKQEYMSTDRVDAEPFLRWLDRWATAQVLDTTEPDLLDSTEALARAADMNGRSLRRVRETGRVSLGLVDRVLIAAGGNTMLWELYDYDELDAAA